MDPAQDAPSTSEFARLTAPIASSAPMPSGAAGGPLAAQGAAGGAVLAGFEALLAALFGEAQGAAASPVPGKAPPPGAGPAFDPAPATLPTAEEDAVEPESGLALASEADALLAAALLTPAAAAPQGAPAAEAEPPPAWGRDKAKGAPAAPALAHANPHARLADKAQAGSLSGVESPEGAVEPDPAPAAPAPTAEPAQPAARALPIQAAAAPKARATEMAAEPASATVGDDVLPPPPAAPSEAPRAALATDAARVAANPPLSPPAQKAVPASEDPTRASGDIAPPRGTAKSAGKTQAASTDAPKAAPAAATADGQVAAASSRDGEPSATPVEGHAAAPAAAEHAGQAAAAAPVRGSPETVANLAAQIVKKLEGRSTRFDVELDPAGLGKVDVRIEVNGQGRISAAMMFENPQAASELKSRSHELQRALEQAGFDLSGGLSFDVSSDRGHARHGGQEQDQSRSHAPMAGRAFAQALDSADGADLAAAPLRLRRGWSDGVDVRI